MKKILFLAIILLSTNAFAEMNGLRVECRRYNSTYVADVEDVYREYGNVLVLTFFDGHQERISGEGCYVRPLAERHRHHWYR